MKEKVDPKQGRAVIVFFREVEDLERFRRSSFYSQIPHKTLGCNMFAIGYWNSVRQSEFQGLMTKRLNLLKCYSVLLLVVQNSSGICCFHQTLMEIKTGLQQTQPTAGRLHSPGTQLALKLMDSFPKQKSPCTVWKAPAIFGRGTDFKCLLAKLGFMTRKQPYSVGDAA